MQLDAADVADDLEDQAAGHARQEAPGAVADAEEDLDRQEYAEEGEVGDVAGESGHIGEVGQLERAGAEGAVLSGVCDVGWEGEIGRHCEFDCGYQTLETKMGLKRFVVERLKLLV